jgi:hypothetical protein
MKYDLAIPLVSFLNHADQPNCRYDATTNCIVALRWLRKGEEATVDYRAYQDRDAYVHQQAATGFTRRPVTWWLDVTGVRLPQPLARWLSVGPPEL